MAVNLGTRGVQEALDLLEYCNVRGGTALSDQRRANGAPEPYDIKLWCLGNEMDGPWQIGHKTAHEYGRLAAETARAMRMIQPDLELVACGSSGVPIPTFGQWEQTVLSETYEYVDMISAHAYYAEEDGDLGSFLASAVDMDHFIDSVTAVADGVRAHKKIAKRSTSRSTSGTSGTRSAPSRCRRRATTGRWRPCCSRTSTTSPTRSWSATC